MLLYLRVVNKAHFDTWFIDGKGRPEGQQWRRGRHGKEKGQLCGSVASGQLGQDLHQEMILFMTGLLETQGESMMPA